MELSISRSPGPHKLRIDLSRVFDTLGTINDEIYLLYARSVGRKICIKLIVIKYGLLALVRWYKNDDSCKKKINVSLKLWAISSLGRKLDLKKILLQSIYK